MIATGEQRLYANLLLTIGVVMPPRVTRRDHKHSRGVCKDAPRGVLG
jgi:hypothetical protein